MVHCRVLCETVKDFVARVGKAYEKNTESSEESEAMAKKVPQLKRHQSVFDDSCLCLMTCVFCLSAVC